MKKTIYAVWRTDNVDYEGENEMLFACESRKVAEKYIAVITKWLMGIPRPTSKGMTYTNKTFEFPLCPLLGDRYDQSKAIYDIQGWKSAKKDDPSVTILYIRESELWS